MALDYFGPDNILRELAERADQKELEQAKMENAELTTQVAAMIQELSQKSKEIQKYHAEHAVVFNCILELVRHPIEIGKAEHIFLGNISNIG